MTSKSRRRCKSRRESSRSIHPRDHRRTGTDAGFIEDGPLLILLHGFPEFWYGWRHQIEPLAAAGFRVLVPDQRGYNLSDKPRRISDYNLDALAGDVVGLIDAMGRDRAFVAAHDWGGAVGWWMGVKHPGRLERLALLNIPHPAVMRQTLTRSPRQLRKSSYMLFFQLPWLPERAFRRQDFDYARRTLRSTSRPGTFTDEDVALYKAAWSQPGAVRSMIHWYRAALRAQPDWPESQRVPVPTLLIWGAKDRFLGQELATASLDLCDRGRLEVIPEATHWVQHEEAGRVNGLVVEFFQT